MPRTFLRHLAGPALFAAFEELKAAVPMYLISARQGHTDHRPEHIACIGDVVVCKQSFDSACQPLYK